MSVENLVRHAAIRSAIYQSQRVGAVPGDADDCDQRVRQDATYGSVGLKVFEGQWGFVLSSVAL